MWGLPAIYGDKHTLPSTVTVLVRWAVSFPTDRFSKSCTYKDMQFDFALRNLRVLTDDGDDDMDDTEYKVFMASMGE